MDGVKRKRKGKERKGNNAEMLVGQCSLGNKRKREFSTD